MQHWQLETCTHLGPGTGCFVHTVGAPVSREDSSAAPSFFLGDVFEWAGLCHAKHIPCLSVNHWLRKSHGPKIPRMSILFWEIPGMSTLLLATTLNNCWEPAAWLNRTFQSWDVTAVSKVEGNAKKKKAAFYCNSCPSSVLPIGQVSGAKHYSERNARVLNLFIPDRCRTPKSPNPRLAWNTEGYF